MSTEWRNTGGNEPLQQCGHCGLMHTGPCPRIKAIEYYPDGTVKRVEYREPQFQSVGPATSSVHLHNRNTP